MALGSTQPLTDMCTKGKGGRCVRLTTLTPSCAVVMKSGNLNFVEPSGTLQACNGTDLYKKQSVLHSRSGHIGEDLKKKVFLLFGDSPAPEFYVPTFRNTLSVTSSYVV
jgi:hypothetical protein